MTTTAPLRQPSLFELSPPCSHGSQTGAQASPPAQSSSSVTQTRADSILHLPQKPTCTPVEAANALGVSERQVRYWIADGTLLAININRDPERKKKTHKILDRWRVVVRRAGYNAQKFQSFLTLEEYIKRASNKQKD